MGNSAGRGRFLVVRGCPLGTVHDRCEWHASGTAVEEDAGYIAAPLAPPDRRVRSVLGDHRLVGKSPEGSWQLDGGLEPDPILLLRRPRPLSRYRSAPVIDP
jgi:hypothetical protein